MWSSGTKQRRGTYLACDDTNNNKIKHIENNVILRLNCLVIDKSKSHTHTQKAVIMTKLFFKNLNFGLFWVSLLNSFAQTPH
jgi:hypothetical protein